MAEERALRRRSGLLVVVVLAGCTGRVRPLGDPDRWDACRARVVIEHDDAPLTQMRELGGQREDVQERFPAGVIDPSRQRPVDAAASLTLEGQPIAWFTATRDAVVLDGSAFAPLRTVDVTRAADGERSTVGRVTSRARESLGNRGVLELLMRVGAIRTYWYVGADLCLVEDGEADGTYRSRWSAVHHTATRGEREIAYGFTAQIDAAGEITVSGTR